MSNVVEQINDAMTSEIETAVPALSELDYVIDPSRQFQNTRQNKNRFGVRPLGAALAKTVTKFYTVDQDFEVILMREYINRDGDDISQRETTFQLYDDLSTIIKALHVTKAGVPSLVLNVIISDILEPEYLESSDVAILRCTFTIKYREKLT